MIKRHSLLLIALFIAFVLAGQSLAAGPIKDSESATHGDEAARVMAIETYDYPGFEIVQFELAVLSQFSYLVVSGQQALVVDPVRDVQAYLDFAEKNSLKIIAVWLTHNHADFVAGHTELAAELDCPVLIGAKAGAGFPHQPLNEGSVIEIGQALIKILETPGHTPEATCGLVSSSSAPDKPLALISGDTLFVGSVGRPDLMGGQVAAASLASMMYDSWTGKLAHLPDHVTILAAHGAGSLCGAHISDEPSSTIGREKAANSYLQHKTRAAFIAAILEGLPEAPQYFSHNAAMNKKGPTKVDWRSSPNLIKEPNPELTDTRKYYLVDLREAGAYAQGHLPNSVNIGLRGRLETWVGIMVPWESELVLCGSLPEIEEAVFRLHRIGYKAGAVTPEDWRRAGLEVRQSEMIAPADLYRKMQDGTSPVVVDVRLPNEWMGLRIGTVLNLPLNRLAEEAVKLEPDKPVVTVCNSAYRSSMAVGILERIGFTKAASLAGGSQAWIEAGLPTYGATASVASTPSPKRELNLPDRLTPKELNMMILDLPGSFELVDIRPPEAFADYHLPGSVNADIAEVLHSPAYLTGAGVLVIVDRDGSLAMAVAGILAQKTKRTIKALHGGLEGYWQASELEKAVKSVPLTRPSPAAGPPPIMSPPAPSPAQPSTPGSPPAPAKPKRKSAGC
jgi:rhodanese-related sulfurtransferase/glyoxylase-like metal-dependent hydrolase (beta-lactamase superfamily II)